MSVVISYYNDRFALILTDRRVTSDRFEHWDEQKLYSIDSVPYGVCAGVGLREGIDVVRNLLASEIEFNDTDAITRYIQDNLDVADFEYSAHTAFSVGIHDLADKTLTLKTVIFAFHIRCDGSSITPSRDRLEMNHFHIFYPSNYIDNPSLIEEFLKKNSLLGDDKWSAEVVFQKAKKLFSTIQQNSTDIVSADGDVGILRVNYVSKEFRTSITHFNSISPQ